MFTFVLAKFEASNNIGEIIPLANTFVQITGVFVPQIITAHFCEQNLRALASFV